MNENVTKPVKNKKTHLYYANLDTTQYTANKVYVRSNKYELFDNWFNLLGKASSTGTFFDIQDKESSSVRKFDMHYLNFLTIRWIAYIET